MGVGDDSFLFSPFAFALLFVPFLALYDLLYYADSCLWFGLRWLRWFYD